MRRVLPVAAMAVLAVSACSDLPEQEGPFEPQASVQQGPPVYMVTYRAGVDVEATTRELAQQHGIAVSAIRLHAARGFTGVIPEPRVQALRADPRVELIEADGPVSLIQPIRGEAGKPGGGGGQVTPWGVDRVGGAGDGTGKTAWVIDSGIDLAHADLNTSRDCHVSFVTRGTNTPQDGNGHGTHVAGTIAAKNDGQGVVGVAAGAYVCAVRVLDNSGSGQWSWVVAGVNHVAANGRGDVANMSLGASGTNATLEKAVADAASAGVKFVLAAGNSGSNAANFTPARVNGANIYTISAVSSSGCMASWSNYGNPPVDYAAPGVSILSTKKGGGTTTMSGTSMAAPHVAGILLLGSVRTNGFASCDPDGNPDPIASR